MKQFSLCLGIFAIVGLSSAWADETAVTTTTTTTNAGQSQAQAQPHHDYRKSPYDANMNLTLQGGVLSNEIGASDRDPAAGLLIYWNMAKTGDTYETRRNFLMGIHTGAIWSNLSGDTSNEDANIYMAPANLFIGYRLLPNLLLSAHGGANVYYQPNARGLRLGQSAIDTNDSDWSVHPNAGLELGVGITPGLSLMARTDMTFTDATDPFVGTVGLGFAL